MSSKNYEKPESISDEETNSMIGKTLGVYRLVQELGRGGMGAVFLAERTDGEFRQNVAIKLIKRGMDTDSVVKRFRQERQILAVLEHPNIAQLLDGGTTDEGLPYFVMEYVDGKTLYDFADGNKLNLRDRLKLFQEILRAVGHAHKNKVVHRDLKPSNILITKNGQPKLLDFGIAKLLDPEIFDETVATTETQMRLMTAEFASPEQVQGLEVTPASDIYTAGMLLYKLLTGKRPYEFPNRAPHEIARIVCEEVPMNPSFAVLDFSKLEKENISQVIGLSPENLSRELRGNLDTIILKALRKLPLERYQSIEQFLEDISRHLTGRQIIANPFPASIAETISHNETPDSIAVLPLKILTKLSGENTDETFLSIGLADTLITRLSQVKNLIVRPTSSVLRFGEGSFDSFTAGKELGVEYILDGNIQTFGKRIRISVQLLHVKNQETVWAKHFDEDSTDIFAFEEKISAQVVKSIVPQLPNEERQNLAKRGTNDSQAYEAYLKGRFYWNQFTSDSLPKAIEWFQKAVELDPNYALAHVGVADFYIWANIYGLIPSLEATKSAEISAKKALEIDDKLGEAYATLGLIKQNSFEWAESEGLHKKAIELNPNYPNAYEWYSANLIGSGRFAEGLQAIYQSEALDEFSLRTKTMVVWTNYQVRQFPEALAKAQEIIDSDNNYPQGHLQKGHILIELGRAEEAVNEIEKAVELMPKSSLAKFHLTFALAAANRPADAKKILRKMKTEATQNYVKPMFLGLASIAVGEIDEAFDYLNKAADELDPWIIWLGTEPKLDSIRRDRRYLELLRRTKNPMYWQFAKISDEAKTLTMDSGTSSPSFFQRHKLKFGLGGFLIAGILTAYLTGVLPVKYGQNGFSIQNSKVNIQKHSIAILPFTNETSDAGNDYLSDGLSENLITQLSNLPQIRVMSRSTSFRYKNKQIDPREIGKEIDVETILVGSVLKQNDEYLVKTELINIADGTQIFAMNFHNKSDKIFALQDEIAVKLIEQLNVQDQEKSSIKKSYTENNEAFQLYLKGEFHRQKATPADIQKSIEFYKQALQLDSNYALAYQGLALAYRSAPAYGTLSPQEAYPQAKESALKALSIDPTLGTAYVPLASMKATYDWDFAGAEKEYKKAIQFAPNNSEAHFSYGNFLVAMERNDEALKELRIALQLDPLSLNTATTIGWALYIGGHFDEAEIQIKQVISRDPTFARAYMNLGEIYQEQGKFDEAIASFQKSKQLSNDVLAEMALGHAYGRAGHKTEALKIAVELEEKTRKKEVSPFLPAVVYAGLNENDKAFYWLERAYQERSNWLTLTKVGLRLKPLRTDPRFEDLLKRIGFEK